MKIAVIGTGYVGLVTGACFADLGYHVTCIDRDEQKIALLRRKESPIYEPGLDELIVRGAETDRLRFETSIEHGAKDADFIFIAVGTPASEIDGLPDLAALKSVIAPVARAAKSGAMIVVKSTVPIGTSRWVQEQVSAFRPKDAISVANNPEFLRQGSAIKDFVSPDRIVAGIATDTDAQRIIRLYEPLTQAGVPLLTTTYESSELIKYASNTMLAAKVAFINEMADLCEQLGANVRDVAKGMGMDQRIGAQFLQPGPGFGGSCFPKDAMALKGMADGKKLHLPLVDAVIASNLLRKQRMVEKIERAFGGDLKGKTLAVLGLTFKAGTDDLRESVSLVIIPALQERGAIIRAYDPQGMNEAKKHLEGEISWCADAYDAANGADACVILTEWNEFRTLDLARLKKALRAPCVIDLRNVYKRGDMLKAGFRYISIGRREVSPGSAEVLDMLAAAKNRKA